MITQPEYILVPRVPTGEMLDAGIDAHMGFDSEHQVDVVWAAMLDTAPQPIEPSIYSTPEQNKEGYELLAAALQAPASPAFDIDEIVNRFLRWPLPDHVSPDGEYPARKWREKWGYPLSGTNLLDAVAARAMFDFCLADMSPPAQLQRVLDEAFRDEEQATASDSAGNGGEQTRASSAGAGAPLPELPGPRMTVAGDDPDRGHWYTADQMREYALAAIAALQQPIGWQPIET